MKLTTPEKVFILDLAERAGKTFVVTAAPGVTLAMTGHGGVLTPGAAVHCLALAGSAVIGSVLLGLAAGWRTGTASLSSTVAQSVPTVGAHAADVPAVVTGSAAATYDQLYPLS